MSDGRGPIGKAAAAAQKEQERAKAQTAQQQREADPCKRQRGPYEENCAKSWIEYFNKRRVLEERQRLMYAAGQAPIGSGPAPGAEAR